MVTQNMLGTYEVKSEVLKKCRVLAATATKTYLKPEDFSEYDVVVIDEASMLILPQAAYAAGLSKDKVVLAGEIRGKNKSTSTKTKEQLQKGKALIEDWFSAYLRGNWKFVSAVYCNSGRYVGVGITEN